MVVTEEGKYNQTSMKRYRNKRSVCFLLITVIFTFTKRSSLSNVPDHPLLTSKGLFLLLSTCIELSPKATPLV